MTDLELQAEALRRKLDARRRTPGYEQNVVAIESEIARLDEEIALERAQGPEAPPPQPPS